MILQEIKSYIRERGEVSLHDIALHFGSDPETLQPMLDFLERKGRVKSVALAANCSSTCHCEAKSDQVMYYWKPGFASVSIEIAGH